METFGEWLRTTLHEQNISQKTLADQIGLTPAQVSRIISGDRGTELGILSKIARVIRRPPEEVYRRAAGLLPTKSEADEQAERGKYLLENYQRPETKAHALEYLEFLRLQEEQGHYDVTPEQKPKPKRDHQNEESLKKALGD